MPRPPDEFLAGAVKALRWEEPFPPVHIAGPISSISLGACLITTSVGYFVVNTGMPSSGPMMIAAIRSRGYRPKDVKLLLSVHAHTDHAGATA